ncbi:MAG: COX15/CtaA family protein [Chthonomonadales bacterium]
MHEFAAGPTRTVERGIMEAFQTPEERSFYRLAIGVLAFNLLIILGGALVRATGSGAGCGQHWPLCNGEVLPGLDDIHRRIEFSHRVLVGLGIIPVILLWWKARKIYTKSQLARKAAFWTGIFTFSESAVGASLVLLKYVGTDASVARSVFVSAHLLNTLLLIGSLSICVVAAANPGVQTFHFRSLEGRVMAACLIAIAFVAATGAVTALGDTLYPAKNVSEIAQSVPASAEILKKLRIIHPFMAMASGGLCVLASVITYASTGKDRVQNLAYVVGGLVAAQIMLGFANLFMLAPIALQLAHLLVADALWIALVFLTVAVTGVVVKTASDATSTPAMSGLAGGAL